MTVTVQLDAYEVQRRRQEGDLEHKEDEEARKEQSGSVVHFYESREEEAESTQQSDHGQHLQEQVAPVDTKAQEEEEPNLFDILNEDVSDIGEDDPTEEEQVEDNDGEDDQN